MIVIKNRAITIKDGEGGLEGKGHYRVLQLRGFYIRFKYTCSIK